MFLVPFSKKIFSNLTEPSSSPSSAKPVKNPSPSSFSTPTSSTESQPDNAEYQGISILIIRSARLSSEILESTIETLKRWLGVLFQALLTALAPPPVQYSDHGGVLAIASYSEGTRPICWRQPIICQRKPIAAHVGYCCSHATTASFAGQGEGKILDAKAIAFDAWKQHHTTLTSASSFTDHSCGMDLCRRRVAQRAVAPETNDGPRSGACYWMSEEQSEAQARARERTTSPQGSEEVLENGGESHELRRRELFQLHGHELRTDGLEMGASGSASVNKVEQQHQHGSKQQQHGYDLQAKRQQGFKGLAANSSSSAIRSSSIASLMSFHNIRSSHDQANHSQEDRRRESVRAKRNGGSIKEVVSASTAEGDQQSLVLVSRSALSTLTDQIAFSMSKMKDLEEQVSVIPELQRRLDRVMNESSKIGDCNRNFKTNLNLQRSGESTTATDLRSNSEMKVPNTEDILTRISSSNQQQPARYCNSFTRTNSLNTQLHAYYGSRDSDLAAKAAAEHNRFVNNHSRQTTPRHVSNLARATQDITNSSSSICSPKVEYEDLISDLISLSYSVNYLPNTSSEQLKQANFNAEPTRSTDSSTQVTGLNSNKQLDPPKQQQQQQHNNKYIASGNINLAGSTSFVDTLQVSSQPNHQHSTARFSDRGCIENKFKSAEDQQQQRRLSLSQATGCARQQVQSSCDDIRDTCSQLSRKSQNIRKGSGSSSILSSSGSNNNNNNLNSGSKLFHDNMILEPSANQTYQQQQQNHSQTFYNSSPHHYHHSRPSISHTRQQNGATGSLSLKTTPVKTALDCGCQSFKEHLRYNSISREQRLNQARSQLHSTSTSNAVSPQPPSQKVDASTNTELSMCDIVTKVELNSLMSNIHKTYSTLSTSTASQAIKLHPEISSLHKPSSLTSEHSSGASTSEPKSSSPLGSESYGQDRSGSANSSKSEGSKSSNCSSNRGVIDEEEVQKSDFSQDSEVDDEERDGEGETDASSLHSDEPYSIGSSYQDPSDFEEYCAYGESLDRRTKDFMSPSTKIPNDLRFALIRLNDFIKRHRSLEQIESSSCIDVIKKEWFEVAATKNSEAAKAKLYVDYFESFTKQLLNTVVNLVDGAGNTAMHYAASHFRLDIIKILLETKVCDVNPRNKAGYTPIMLLALAEIEGVEEQATIKRLFSIGDVNIRARSSGQTALMLAANHGRVATCRLLLESGADPSLQDFDGSTALMCGSEIGNEEIVRCLLAHRLTDPSAVDNDGLDALTIAMNNGHKNIGLLLYASKNVPRNMFRSASLRRNSSRIATNFVRRADSLLGSRAARQFQRIESSNL